MAEVNEQIEFLKLIAERLDRCGLPYMVTGSFAMALYAVPRTTRDIDIVFECKPQDADKVAEIFAADCYVDLESVREAAASQGMFNIIHQGWVLKADLIVRKDAPYRKLEFDRRRFVEIDNTRIAVVTVEDLILSKLVWARRSESELQQRDVREMIECVKKLDWEYLETWSVNLGVHDLLMQAKPK